MPKKRRYDRDTTLRAGNPLLDAINVRLLRELQKDPRLPMSALARRVKMSAPAVTERVKRLEDAEVIAGYRVEIDPGALGFHLTAYVRVRPTPGQLLKVAELAQRTPEVVECHRVTGEDCFLLKIHVPKVDDLEVVLDRFLAVGQTTTSIVQSSPVQHRGLPLPTD